MSVEEWSIIYNAVFIVILCVVCLVFSRIHLKIADTFTRRRNVFTALYFVSVTFTTIVIWQTVINIIT